MILLNLFPDLEEEYDVEDVWSKITWWDVTIPLLPNNLVRCTLFDGEYRQLRIKTKDNVGVTDSI